MQTALHRKRVDVVRGPQEVRSQNREMDSLFRWQLRQVPMYIGDTHAAIFHARVRTEVEELQGEANQLDIV